MKRADRQTDLLFNGEDAGLNPEELHEYRTLQRVILAHIKRRWPEQWPVFVSLKKERRESSFKQIAQLLNVY